jgi:hypothetical protein
MKSSSFSLLTPFAKASFKALIKLRRRTMFLNQQYRIDYAVCHRDAMHKSTTGS